MPKESENELITDIASLKCNRRDAVTYNPVPPLKLFRFNTHNWVVLYSIGRQMTLLALPISTFVQPAHFTLLNNKQTTRNGSSSNPLELSRTVREQGLRFDIILALILYRIQFLFASYIHFLYWVCKNADLCQFTLTSTYFFCISSHSTLLLFRSLPLW